MALVVILFIAVFFFVALLGYALFFKNSSTLLKIAIIFIIVFLSIVAVTFKATLIDLQNVDDYSELGPFGDYIGGVLNPLISGFAVFAAGFAFYAQYQANKQVQKQFKVQQFENQFYEMIRLHKENVNTLYLRIKKKVKYSGKKQIVESTVTGKMVFDLMAFEFQIIYMIGLKNFFNETPKARLNEVYNIFFKGISERDKGIHSFYDEILELESYLDKLDYKAFNTKIKDRLKFSRDITPKIEFALFKGHARQLSHYYRHLFLTVKFVANQDETFMSYEKKRNYLRILRSQLSDTEQIFLFYNWYSDFGKQWENNENKFLTDYRMIHNLFDDLLIDQFKLEEIFNLNGGYRKEAGRDFDSLFEYQDFKKTT